MVTRAPRSRRGPKDFLPKGKPTPFLERPLKNGFRYTSQGLEPTFACWDADNDGDGSDVRDDQKRTTALHHWEEAAREFASHNHDPGDGVEAVRIGVQSVTTREKRYFKVHFQVRIDIEVTPSTPPT